MDNNGATDAEFAATGALLLQKIDALTANVVELRALVGPFGVPMSNGSMLVQTLYGIKYLIDPGLAR